MQGHPVDVHTGNFSGNGACQLWHLGGCPHFDLAILHAGGAVHRFHRRVREKRRLVRGPDHAAGLGLDLRRIAFFEEGKAVFCFQRGVQFGLNLI